jgi:rod shape-determining protein MreC
MRVRTRTWFGIVAVSALLFLAASRIALFQPVEDSVLTVAEPIESALRRASRPIADVVNNITDIDRLRDENQALREENERLLQQIARLREVETENQQLRGLLELREERPGDTFLPATVFARDPNSLTQAIAIDRGRADGVQEGMVVLTEQGSLVGTVTRALSDVAWVTLITDPTSAVSAVIQGSRAQGVVVGAADGTLTMEFVERTADVKEGDLVLTSGVGGRHPRGEVIGEVVDVDEAAQELFQAVRVQPLADFSRLERVVVLTSFLPQEAPAQ